MTITNIKKTFKDKKLIEEALIHQSWLREHPEVKFSNERLEFLGDAVLELVVTQKLYKKLPNEREGFLTALRSKIVNTQNLYLAAQKLGIEKALSFSKGIDIKNGRERKTVLCDAMEAIIGATYLDQGMDEATKFIEKNILHDLDIKISEPLKNPKSILMETAQTNGLKQPTYRVIASQGPDHAKKFIVGVFIDDKELGRGEGQNKSEAGMQAAQAGLVKLSEKR